jgi:acyl dehydratase
MLPIDRSIVGREFDRTVLGPVTREDILEYAASYGETNPWFTDEEAARRGPHGGLVAPPTFPVRLRGQRFIPAELPESFLARSFDAGKDLELGEPVRPGDVLTASSTVHDIYEKTGRSGRMAFVVFRTTVTNQKGQMVAVIDHRMMFR